MKTLMLSLIRLYFKILSAIAPTQAGVNAFHLFQRTRKLPFKKEEANFYHHAKRFEVVHPRENIRVYETGNPEGDLVLLVHGWESNAGSLSAIAKTLSDLDYHVVALDLPAHGHSQLTHTNLRECTEALRALIYQLRPVKPFSIISHSFGSAVTAMALAESRYEIDNWVMLTSPNKIFDIFNDYKKQIALNENAFQELLQQAQFILKESIDDVTVERKAAQINYKSLTLIHDVNDKVLPFSNTLRFSKVLRNAELYKLKNAGHYRMLYNEGVLFKVSWLFSKTNDGEGTEKYEEFRVSELMSA